MKEKIYAALAMIFMTVMFSAVPVSMAAENNNWMELQKNDGIEENSGAGCIEDTIEIDSLDDTVIDVMTLSSSEENNCQLTISARMPDGFDANIYVQLKNYSTGRVYQYTLYEVNGFSQRGYVPEGEYRMLECGVYGDTNGVFPFILVDDFSLKYGEVSAEVVSLQDEQTAIEIIEKRTSWEVDGIKNIKKLNSVFTNEDFNDRLDDADLKKDNGISSQSTYLIVALVIIGLIGTGMLAIIFYFRKQIVPMDVYTIHEYMPVKDQKGNGLK